MPPLVNPAALHRSTAVCAWRLQWTQNHPAGGRGGFVSGDQIFVTILMPGPMVDAVTQDLMYWPFEAAGLALMIAPMSAL